MGYGDDIMSTALARAVLEHAEKGGEENAKIVFGDPDTYHDPDSNRLNVYFSDLYLNNPHILQPGESGATLVCVPEYPGSRMYVDRDKCDVRDKRIIRFAFKPDFEAVRGELYFSDEELEVAEKSLKDSVGEDGFIVIEPCGKNKLHSNKLWPVTRWAKVLEALSLDVPLVQFIHDSTEIELPSTDKQTVFHIEAPFRMALAAMQVMGQGVIGTDGGLHHAAAALDQEAVVLWSHYSTPKLFGYEDHYNVVGDYESLIAEPCGRLYHCGDCSKSMDAISVETVVEAIKATFG